MVGIHGRKYMVKEEGHSGYIIQVPLVVWRTCWYDCQSKPHNWTVLDVQLLSMVLLNISIVNSKKPSSNFERIFHLLLSPMLMFTRWSTLSLLKQRNLVSPPYIPHKWYDMIFELSQFSILSSQFPISRFK